MCMAELAPNDFQEKIVILSDLKQVHTFFLNIMTNNFLSYLLNSQKSAFKVEWTQKPEKNSLQNSFIFIFHLIDCFLTKYAAPSQHLPSPKQAYLASPHYNDGYFSSELMNKTQKSNGTISHVKKFD